MNIVVLFLVCLNLPHGQSSDILERIRGMVLMRWKHVPAHKRGDEEQNVRQDKAFFYQTHFNGSIAGVRPPVLDFHPPTDLDVQESPSFEFHPVFSPRPPTPRPPLRPPMPTTSPLTPLVLEAVEYINKHSDNSIIVDHIVYYEMATGKDPSYHNLIYKDILVGAKTYNLYAVQSNSLELLTLRVHISPRGKVVKAQILQSSPLPPQYGSAFVP